MQNRRLRPEKALDVQGFEWKSNCTEMAKYTCDFKHKIYCNIYIQQNLAKQFTLHAAEAYSEPFPTSKQEGYLIGGNCFIKKLYLRCLKRFWLRCCPVNHKNSQIAYGKHIPHGNFKASYISVLNNWKIFKTNLTTESN